MEPDAGELQDPGPAPPAEVLDIIQQAMEEDEDDPEADLPMDQEESTRELYLRIYHIGKNIASKACRDQTTARRMVGKMRQLLSELVEVPAEDLPNDHVELQSAQNSDEEVVDVVDNVGRPRGRPRAIRNATDRVAAASCRICGFRHDTTACIKYAECMAVHERFRNYEGPQRRCGVCSEPGHNARRCPIKKDAIAHYEQLEHI